MTPFNMFLLLVVVVAAALGFRSGIIKQAGAIAAIIIGIIVCRMFGNQATAWVQNIVTADNTSPLVTSVLAYAGLFIITYFVVTLLAGFLHRVVHAVHLGAVDRLCGAAFKVLLWCFVLSIALNVWAAFVPESRPDGVWAQRVEALAPMVMGMNVSDSIG